MPQFTKVALKELLEDGVSATLVKVQDTLVGRRRWSLEYELVFKEAATGRYFRVGYTVGATEQQDEGPFEYNGDLVDVQEVRPIERVIEAYEPVS